KGGPGAKPANQVRMKLSTEGGVPPGSPPGAPPGEKGGDETEEVAVSKILADERTNKLIIIASDRSFNQIMALKKELDIPADVNASQIQVLHLRHADAEELA